MTPRERAEEALQTTVDRGELPGAVAGISDGDDVEVVCVGVRDLITHQPMTRDTLFRIASLTKPMSAAVAMAMIEDGTLSLDEPVVRWLPELADQPVLRTLASTLDDVVLADRPITVRHVLTFTHGYGAVMAPPGTYPIQAAIDARQLGPGPDPQPISPDEWIGRLGTLPLMHQPGAGWTYHGGGDILGVLLARAGGADLETVMKTRLFEPLGMRDTSFGVTAPARLAQAYRPDDGGHLRVCPEPEGRWSPPLRASGATGLVSTVDDVLTFGRMLLAGGAPILSAESVRQMTTDQVTAAQKAAAHWIPGFWQGWGWGFGGAIATGTEQPGPAAGSYGWTGGTGTAAYTDRRGQRIHVLLTQREMTSPKPEPYLTAFWSAVAG